MGMIDGDKLASKIDGEKLYFGSSILSAIKCLENGDETFEIKAMQGPAISVTTVEKKPVGEYSSRNSVYY